MVAGQILVVLGEQLGVLECDHRTVGGFYHSACVAYAAHFSSSAVTLYPVTDVDTASH